MKKFFFKLDHFIADLTLIYTYTMHDTKKIKDKTEESSMVLESLRGTLHDTNNMWGTICIWIQISFPKIIIIFSFVHEMLGYALTLLPAWHVQWPVASHSLSLDLLFKTYSPCPRAISTLGKWTTESSTPLLDNH